MKDVYRYLCSLTCILAILSLVGGCELITATDRNEIGGTGGGVQSASSGSGGSIVTSGTDGSSVGGSTTSTSSGTGGSTISQGGSDTSTTSVGGSSVGGSTTSTSSGTGGSGGCANGMILCSDGSCSDCGTTSDPHVTLSCDTAGSCHNGCDPGWVDCTSAPGCETQGSSCPIPKWEVCVEHSKDTLTLGYHAGLTANVGSRVNPPHPPMPGCLSPEPASVDNSTDTTACCEVSVMAGDAVYISIDTRGGDGTYVYSNCTPGDAPGAGCNFTMIELRKDGTPVLQTMSSLNPAPFVYDGQGTSLELQPTVTVP